MKESDARVLVATASAATVTTTTIAVATSRATAAAQPQKRLVIIEEDDITGEVLLLVMNMSLHFASLLYKEFVKIFCNKFKPINLCQLRHIGDLWFNVLYNYDQIGIKNRMLQLWKSLGIYKNSGKSFYKVWIDIFYNYITIPVFFFRKKTPDFHNAFGVFYAKVYKQSKFTSGKK